jgi:acylphosphatase
MELKNINTKSFLFDPKSEDFEIKMISKSKVFDLKEDRKKWLTYITLVYDVNSEIRKNYREYMQRKALSADISGFKRNKEDHFEDNVENCLLGEDDNFNKVVCEYSKHIMDKDYKLLQLLINKYDLELDKQREALGSLKEKERSNLNGMKQDIEELVNKIYGGEESARFKRIFYEDIDRKLFNLLTDSYYLEIKNRKASDSSLNEKERKNLYGMKSDIEELERKILGEDEVINLKKILYYGSDGARDKLPRVENVLVEFEKNGLIDYSPYPGYFPEKLKFVGDYIPKN